MDADSSQAAAVAAARVAQRHPDLRMLLLVGSRARGDTAAGSDWDFAYLAGPGLDAMALLSDLAEACDSDEIDLGNLAGAGGLFRHRAARDGDCVYEAEPGTFALVRGGVVLVRRRAHPQRGLRSRPRGPEPVTLDRALLAEKAAALERHLARVKDRLPGEAGELHPGSDAADVASSTSATATCSASSRRSRSFGPTTGSSRTGRANARRRRCRWARSGASKIGRTGTARGRWAGTR